MAKKQTPKPDLIITDNGSVHTVSAATKAGLEWIDASLSYESWQMLGASIAVDPRASDAIREGALNDGLVVE